MMTLEQFAASDLFRIDAQECERQAICVWTLLVCLYAEYTAQEKAFNKVYKRLVVIEDRQ